jgi:hypothetical protein
MNRLLGVLLGMVLLGSAARAQVGGSRPAALGTPGGLGGGFNSSPGLGGGIGNSFGSPTVSPYLNITRGGGSAAQNYFGLVRPQQNIAGALQNLQSQVTAGQNSSDDAQSQGVTVGTRVRFLNTGGYFQNMNGGTTSSTPLGSASGGSLQANRPDATTLGGLGYTTLRGGFGSQGGSFGTSGTGGARGPR